MKTLRNRNVVWLVAPMQFDPLAARVRAESSAAVTGLGQPREDYLTSPSVGAECSMTVEKRTVPLSRARTGFRRRLGPTFSHSLAAIAGTFSRYAGELA